MKQLHAVRYVSGAILALLACNVAVATDLSTEPVSTYVATSNTDVKPNIMFVLDDSGSMDWDYMPDEANSSIAYQFRNSKFNGLAYNPTITYTPPVKIKADGTVDTATPYLNMTGEGTTTGGDAFATSGSRNWNSVKNDAYGIQSVGVTSSLTPTATSAPYYFTSSSSYYCKSSVLRQCQAGTPDVNYTVPAYLRWCKDSTATDCKATYEAGAVGVGYSTAVMQTPRQTTITFASATSAVVTGITVDSLQIMQGSSNGGTSTNNVTNLASYVATQINNCTYIKQGNCGIVGYTATSASGVVTITAPGATSATPAVTKTGTVTVTPVAFAQGTLMPGDNLRTTITPTVTSYTKASTVRLECAASTSCTYNEEMTNYANWYTYYRTRMQMMKTSVAKAFSEIDSAADITDSKSKFRIGFMTINNNQGTDFANLGEFSSTIKGNWYSKLTNAKPNNSTPLRVALSDVGRMYAGLLNGTSFNGVTVTDPLQYSCQKNFTLLSTDGFWNGGAGYKLDGSTAVDNQDAGFPNPYGDGGTVTYKARTSKLQTASVSPRYLKKTSQLQTRTASTQTAPSIQKRTSSNSGGSYGAWSDVGSCTAVNTGVNRVQCQVPRSDSSNAGASWSNWYYVSTCTVDNTGTNRVACSGSVYVVSSWADVSSCTVAGATQCQYAAWSTQTTVSSCTAAARSAASPYTVGLAVDCQDTTGVAGTWVDVTGTCTQTTTTGCQYTNWTSFTSVTACTDLPRDTGPLFTVLTARECQTTTNGGTSDTLADVAMYYYKTDLRTTSPSTAADTTGTCTGPIISPNTTANDLCDNNVPTYGRDTTANQHMTTFTLGLGAQGKMVYAPLDGKDYWKDTSGDFYDVLNGSSTNTTTGVCMWQSSGVCLWPTPASNTNANIDDLWHAAINGRGTYYSAKDPSSLSTSLKGMLTAIDAIPRPGTQAAAATSNPNVSSTDNFMFSSNYESVTWNGELTRRQIETTTGAFTAPNWSASRLLDCATQTWQSGKHYLKDDSYRYGSFCYLVLTDYSAGASFDGSATGQDGMSTRQIYADEAATAPVSVVAPTGRTIYTDNTTSLIPFTSADLATAGLDYYFTQGYLATLSGGTPNLAQFCASGSICLSPADQTAASGATLVNFLRGDRTHEGSGAGGYYRTRKHVLGDIVSSEGRYVKTPLFNYTDAGYADFKTLMATRKGVLYVGANDGMLHAFDGDSGKELWAYVPNSVLPDIHKLASVDYSTNHRYFVDNTPELGEISVPCTPVFPATTCNPWRNILVGSFNRGGTRYFALDVTDPDSPTYLWSFTATTMGYTYGGPRVTKLKDGTWVVIMSSGYNNADGKGYVYVVNAFTGTLIRTISNNVGTPALPNSIADISAHAPNTDNDNTTRAVYGGDLQGNLWRFDINGDLGAAGYDAQKLITFTAPNGSVQPITAKPVVATIEGNPVVFVGTGRFLGTSDITDTQIQSFYAVKDDVNATPKDSPRNTDPTKGLIQQTFLTDTCQNTDLPYCDLGKAVRRSTLMQAVDWTANNGWFVDLPAGEKAYTDPALALGLLAFTTNIPSLSSATVCGQSTLTGAQSYLYVLNYLTGTAAAPNNLAASYLGGYATRPVFVKLPDGSVRIVVTRSGQDPANFQAPTPPGGTPGVKRVSWRELIVN